MVKKLFALASVTALTGLLGAAAVAGCSSTTTQEVAADGAPGTGTSGTSGGAKTDTGTTKPKTDSGTTIDEEDSSTGPTTCPTSDPIDQTALPWKAPYKAEGACTEKNLADLVTYVDTNASAKYADWKKQVSATCATCIFGKETDATWKPLLEDSKGQLVELNVGGCIGIASDNVKCGQAYQNWFDCRFEACAECPEGDSAALSKCLSAASKTACKPAFNAVGTVCGDQAIGDAETACNGDSFVFEGPIRLQCIGTEGGGG